MTNTKLDTQYWQLESYYRFLLFRKKHSSFVELNESAAFKLS